MSQQPPPPPYGGPPGPPKSGMTNKAKFWIGVALAIPALLVAGVTTGAAVAVVDGVGGSPSASTAVSSVVGLLIFAGFIAAVVFPRTRWIALGIMAGAAVLFILAAGACVALLVGLNNSYS